MFAKFFNRGLPTFLLLVTAATFQVLAFSVFA